MENQKPFAFKVFIIDLCATVFMVIVATFLSNNPAYRKYAVLSTIPIILIFTMSAIGIYSALITKHENAREKKLNRIGLFGNIVICVFFLSIMIGGMVLAMR